jgi:adenylosuccinate lyase
MNLSPLSAISPIDGRYHNSTQELSSYFSEAALIKFRVYVEIEYFISLCEIPLPQLKNFDKSKFDALRKVYSQFTESDAEAVKLIEKTTNHDVKAVEYFIKDKFNDLG